MMQQHSPKKFNICEVLANDMNTLPTWQTKTYPQIWGLSYNRNQNWDLKENWENKQNIDTRIEGEKSLKRPKTMGQSQS